MAAIGGVTSTAPTATTASKDIFGGLGPDAFLKLLVAQLRYQNPMNPSDPTAMMAQIAQYAQVEALTKLQQGQAVDQSLSEAKLATDMVGKFVTASDGTITESGKVLSARFTPTGPVLVLDSGSEVTLSAVTRVDQLADAVTAPAATTPPSTPSTPSTAPTASTPSTPAASTPTPTTPATEPAAAINPPAAVDPLPPVVPVVPAVVDPIPSDPSTTPAATTSLITTSDTPTA